jgi:hypothetical protein
VFREGWKTGIGFQPFVLSRSPGETPRKRVFQPPWNHRQADLQKIFLPVLPDPDCRKRLGSGNVQCVAVRHGW